MFHRGPGPRPEVPRLQLVQGAVAPQAAYRQLMQSDGGAGPRRAAINPAILVGVVLTLVFGVANRILYKMALVPMGHYTVMLAQAQNIGYLAVYFTTLWLRYNSGAVTSPMLALDKRPFLVIGVCEAVSQLLFMFAAANLPGAILPIINQSSLLFNMLFAAVLMNTRYSRKQLAGAALITLGVVLAAAPSTVLNTIGLFRSITSGAQPVALNPLYVFLGVLSFAFPAVASIVKDMIFRKQRERLGQPLDIFVVNSFGSLCQFMFVPLLLPMTIKSNGLHMTDMPAYVADGARCFIGRASGCEWSPLLPVAYVLVNLGYNIAMLTLQRNVGAVSCTIVSSCLVPLTIVAFSFPLPLLMPSVMGPGFLIGTILLCGGLTVYNSDAFLTMLTAAASLVGDLFTKLVLLLQVLQGEDVRQMLKVDLGLTAAV